MKINYSEFLAPPVHVHKIKKSARATLKLSQPDETSVRQYLHGTFQRKASLLKKEMEHFTLDLFRDAAPQSFMETLS